MLGLGSNLSAPSIASGDLQWSATKYLYLPGATGDYARVQSFSNFINRISDSGDDDIADTITVSFWVKPLWVMGNVGSNQHVTTGGGIANSVWFPVFGNTSTEKDRIRIYYHIDTGSGTDKNRLVVQAVDASGNKEMDEVFIHSTNNSITGVGSSLTGSGIASGWWHSENKGNVNGDDFVHLCFVRSSGDWTIYWNGTALGSSVDADSGTLDFAEENVDEFWVGKSLINQDYVKTGYRDIAYFNAALSGTEVRELYNTGEFFDVRTHAQAANLGLYWPCQDAQEFSGAGANADLDLQGNSSFTGL